MNVLVTGGAGFIGSTLVRRILARSDAHVRVLDAFTYAGLAENLDGLRSDWSRRLDIARGDVADPVAVREAVRGCDAVLHLAAESHVDRSIESDADFLRTNVIGTGTLLSAARREGVDRVVLVSTDEVYGDLPLEKTSGTEAFQETDPLRPNSPYAASKASAELLGLAAFRTHGMDVVITRGSNTYGPRQLPEKLVPRLILRARAGGTLPVFGHGRHVRDWIHVDDHADGILAALEHGRPGQPYNLGGRCERSNLEMAELILTTVREGPQPGEADRATLRHVADRPGHDLRYALDSTRAQRELHWSPGPPIEDRLGEVAKWYGDHFEWVAAATERVGRWG